MILHGHSSTRLIPYVVSGAALNMAYFDLSYAIFALLAALRMQVEQHVVAAVPVSPELMAVAR